MSLRRLLAIVIKELRQIRRDRVTLAMIVGVPVMQLILFGYAINFNLRHLDAGIVDQAQTSASRALVMDMLATEVIAPVAHPQTPKQLMGLLQRGKISVGIVIPPDFERRRAEGRQLAQILVDGSDSAVEGAAAQLARVPVQRYLPDARAPMRSTPQLGSIGILRLYNPERRTAVNIVPALVGVILTMTLVMFTSIAIVRERERGNMEMLLATPLRASELMIGKVLPYVVIGLVQTTLVLVLGLYLFDVPLRGSVLDAYGAAILLIVANLTLGLLISTKVRTQFQAMQMTMFVMLPSILLSGFVFPFSGMPEVVQWLAEVLPLTHFVRLIRGVMLRGAGLGRMWGEVLALLVFIVVMLSLAISRFRKRLD